MSVRWRLTLAYGAVFLLGTGVVLGASYLLVSAHLERTMGATRAAEALSGLAGSYGLVAAGLALASGAFGWVVAGRALRPLEATLARQTELVESQRQFVANASHELRSPLTVIRTEADVTLADPAATVADLRAMGQVVLEGTERTDALLDGLLLLASARPELLRREPVDLRVAVRAALAETADEAAERDLTVRATLPPAGAAHGGYAVAGDPALLGRLVANLVENAVRHNRAGGAVDVRVSHAAAPRAREGEAGAVALEVSNDGQRIAPEDAERLTQPFERLGRARDESGSGLGLSIVAAVVAAHGGELALSARREGGLAATVTLPASGAPATAAAPPVGAR